MYGRAKNSYRPLEEESRAIADSVLASPTSGKSPEHLARQLAEAYELLVQAHASASKELNALKMVLDNLEEGIAVVDRRGRVVFLNRAVEQLFGPFPNKALGRHYIEIIPVAGLDRSLRQVREDGLDRTIEYTTTGTPQRLYRLDIRNWQGECVIIIRDISQQRAVENMRRDFVANASHEIRTPLTAIQGFADALLEDETLKDEQRRFVELISQSAERMSTIVNDLLNLSKIEHPDHPIIKRPIDLADIVHVSLIPLTPLAQQKNIRIHENLQPVTILGNEDLIDQVVVNLVSNAIRHTPPGGTITVQTERITGKGGMAMARLTVEDTGVGIEPEERLRIFERFYRIDRGRSRDAGGTGLGLSIVRNIIERHGGRVWVEDGANNRGSRFVCKFPALSSEPESEA